MSEENNKPVDGQDPNLQIPVEDAPIDEGKPNGEPQEPIEIDYKNKFTESSKEALRLLEENKEKDAEIERLRRLSELKTTNDTQSDLNNDEFPEFFDHMSEVDKKNLIDFTTSIENRALKKISQNPAIAHSQVMYNTNRWDSAFEKAVEAFPELANEKADFKSKYFRADNVPENMDDLMPDLAKVYLFDKARDIGAKDVLEKENRIDTERQNGGGNTQPSGKSLEDWQRLAQSNPAEYARRAAEYHKEMETGLGKKE